MTDVTRALAFYERAFGWRRAPAELHEYFVFEVPEGCPFGVALVPGQSSGTRGGLTAYFSVTDPAAVCQAVIDAGGRKRLGPTVLPGYGTIYQVEDPDGNRWGLFATSAAARS